MYNTQSPVFKEKYYKKGIKMKKIYCALLCALPLFAAGKMEVTSSPYCGCCNSWVAYMQKNGYEVKSIKTQNNLAIKERYKIPLKMQSCHTGVIENYVVEGHVPESAVAWLLKNKPHNVLGISTPGMPIGSPGMEQGNIKEEYPVMLMYKDGSSKLFGIYQGDKLIKPAM